MPLALSLFHWHRGPMERVVGLGSRHCATKPLGRPSPWRRNRRRVLPNDQPLVVAAVRRGVVPEFSKQLFKTCWSKTSMQKSVWMLCFVGSRMALRRRRGLGPFLFRARWRAPLQKRVRNGASLHKCVGKNETERGQKRAGRPKEASSQKRVGASDQKWVARQNMGSGMERHCRNG
jgi:hypothetical protein